MMIFVGLPILRGAHVFENVFVDLSYRLSFIRQPFFI